MRKSVLDSEYSGSGNICITSSNKLDVAFIVIFLVLLVTTSFFLRVYYRVTVSDVRVEYTDSNGKTKALHIPAKFRKNRFAAQSTDTLLRNLEEEIDKYMKSSGWYLYYLEEAPGAHIDWIIRYSYNSTNLNRLKVIRFDANYRF